MRAKVPPSIGVNPAFWLLGPNLEIDGFEFFEMNRSDAPQMTIYSNENTSMTGGACWGNSGKSRIFSQTAHKGVNGMAFPSSQIFWPNLPDLSLGFYHYTIVFDPNYITFWIESDNYQQAWVATFYNIQQQGISNINPNANCSCIGCTIQINANFPVSHGNNSLVIDNNAAQSLNFITGAKEQKGPLLGVTSTFEIDWVKIYVQDNCSQNINLNSGIFKAVDFGDNNYITGDNITLGGGGGSYTIDYVPWSSGADPTTITPQLDCLVRANNEISLLDGFCVKQDAIFEATIAFSGTPNLSSDCNTQNYWSQIYRTTNTEKNTEDKLSKINVYPNPASDKLYIKINGDYKSAHLTIINMMGSIVLEKILNGNDELDISQLINGVYFCNIETIEKNSFKSKLIITK